MNAPLPKVLIADDDASIRLVLSHAFTRAGFQVRATGAAHTLLKWASDGEGDVVVTDVVMPDENVFEVLPRIRAARPSLPIIVMSAPEHRAHRRGGRRARRFRIRPQTLRLGRDRRRDAPGAGARQARRPTRGAGGGKAQRPVEPLLGRSAAMQALYRSLARLVASDAPTLVTGEPGSGRSLIARTLHDLGPQRERAFTVVACGFAGAADLQERSRPSSPEAPSCSTRWTRRSPPLRPGSAPGWTRSRFCPAARALASWRQRARTPSSGRWMAGCGVSCSTAWPLAAYAPRRCASGRTTSRSLCGRCWRGSAKRLPPSMLGPSRG